jgi:hypothetical protein
MLTKFFLNSKRFWLLLVPFVVQHVLLPLAAKAGINLPAGTDQAIIDWVLGLLQAGGVFVALQGGVPVSLTKPSA